MYPRLSPFSYLLLGFPLAFGAACAAAGRYGPEASLAAAPAASASARTSEAAFLAENDAAMNVMMRDMSVAPSGDVDRDFVAMMAPHHQGAVDMALALLRYGKNEQLRRLAQEIIVEQLQEITAMRLAIGQPIPVPAPAPTQARSEP